jgi:hypothetical protein
MAAGLLAPLPVVSAGLLIAGASPGFVPIALGLPTLRGLLFGLGVTLIDRWRPQWPRCARWALGMLMGGLVPIYTIWSGGTPPSAPAHAALEVCGTMLAGLVLGILLGLGARSERGRYWRLPLLGLAADVVALALLIGIQWLYNRMHMQGRPLLAAGGLVMGHWPNSIVCPLFPLIGLALANRLAAAQRLAEQRYDTWPGCRGESGEQTPMTQKR